ncbi:MAG TPA: copper chaperone PCu(A)C [Burkholderiaceae bacterium]|nr:copper chaperone PCu(A)C [Burkholderiaceae bacterium]
MIRFIVSAVLVVASGTAAAQVQVKDAWARPALQGQTATGAFMSLMSSDGARLVGVSSPVAGVVEIHEMVMEGSVMKMRAIPGLDLPPGRSVELKPGGYHVMLMDLKRPLKAGERVPVELRIETRDKRLVTQPIEIEVATRAPAAAAGAHKH